MVIDTVHVVDGFSDEKFLAVLEDELFRIKGEKAAKLLVENTMDDRGIVLGDCERAQFKELGLDWLGGHQ